MSYRESEGGERPARVIFLGMQSNFSHPSLRALLAAGSEVCAVVLPATQNELEGPALRRLEAPSRRRTLLPVNQSFLHTGIQQLAWDRALPLWEVARLDDPTVAELFASLQPDLICVACFSHFIPPSLLAIPRLGAVNVHPSLLPDNRGPEPLFWTFRLGQEQTGVTIHLMEAKLDSGPILVQKKLAVPEGISYAELEQEAAELGGTLLVRAVTDLMRGQARPRPQDESQSRYHPFPSNQPGSDDFVIRPAQWDARHVYNFICGLKDWGETLTLVADEELTLLIEDVLDYSYKPNDLRLHTRERDAWPVRCRRGVVIIKGRPLRA
ncbi:MAG TPA: formyltransferase family protein [Ktedonobacteraceae bacterium]|nr:formyltransferase family protein [Ktedonobacteraceae bacterium]